MFLIQPCFFASFFCLLCQIKHQHCIYPSAWSCLTAEHPVMLFHTAHLRNRFHQLFACVCAQGLWVCVWVGGWACLCQRAHLSYIRPLLVVQGMHPHLCCHHSAVFVCACVCAEDQVTDLSDNFVPWLMYSDGFLSLLCLNTMSAASENVQKIRVLLDLFVFTYLHLLSFHIVIYWTFIFSVLSGKVYSDFQLYTIIMQLLLLIYTCTEPPFTVYQ